MRLLALSILFVTLISGVKATHIVGGELYYDCLGSNDYRLTVKVYRDCGPNNVNGTPFDDPLPLTIYDGANNLVRVVYIPLVTPLSIPTTTTNPCLIPPPQCIEVATYSSIENLPPTPGGYTIVYQRCCRNSSILNLTSPSSEGGTYFIKIPDPGVVTCNSSPRFSALPPLVICANDNFSFNHSATDPDGDSLVYDFYTPLQGGTASAPSPDPSSPPPYFPIAWAPGFSQNNQINGTPNLTINSSTGMLTCTPSVIGIYVYAVKVSEYRGGVLLSEALREFQINIVNCTVAITADIQPQSAVQLCSGLTLQFTNTSVNATSYYWDFGDTTTTADNSTLVNPSYTFPDTGTYYVTLVANPGTVCNDSIVVPFEVHLPLNVTFAQPDAQCVNTNSFDLLATGNFTPDA
ncbi:MAG TPA: PKD domain-containing protein, partial [Flavobacteriales bacterium]|nr:PKD domain-containing protein [Flavobacteriales bacterium]